MSLESLRPRSSRLTTLEGVDATTPASRLSTEHVLEESTRPSAVPDDVHATPVSVRGRTVARHLLDVHDHYRAEMAEVLDVLERVRAGTASLDAAQGTIERMTIRANDWALGGLCQRQCFALTQHHLMESTGIFPHLRESDAALGVVLDRLHDEHQVIHELLERVDVVLGDLVRRPTDYEALTDVLRLLHDTLTSHFAYEERELLLPLARFGFYEGQV